MSKRSEFHTPAPATFIRPPLSPLLHEPLAVNGRSATDEMEQILDAPPALADRLLRGGTRLTRRWSHGELHAALPALDTHVVMTYYGTAQKALWRQGASRVESRTRRGSITLIPEGDEGRWDVDGPIEVSHIYLPDWRLQAAAEAIGLSSKVELIGRNCFDDPSSAQLLELLSREAGSGDQAAALFVEQAVDLLCTQLIRSHSSYGAATATAPRRGLADWQIKRVTDYMTEAMHREMTLDELAALVQLSRYHFCASFKLATGMTPHEWLTAIRMRRAAELLAKTDLSIIQVALEVGYQTPSAFTASFRRSMNVTPTSYRRSTLE